MRRPRPCLLPDAADVLRGHHVEVTASAVLEHRDRVGARPTRVLAATQFEEVGSYGGRIDRSGFCRDDEVAGLVHRCVTRVDEDLCALHDTVVDLAVIGQECTHTVDVRAGPKQLALDEWFASHGRGRDAVSYTHLTLPTTPYV